MDISVISASNIAKLVNKPNKILGTKSENTNETKPITIIEVV